MKKITSAFLVIGLFVISLASCKKDDSTKVDEEDVKSAKMTYKLDGTSKTSTLLFAVKENGAIGISGFMNETETIVLAIDNFHGVGEYTVDDEHVVISYTNGSNSQSNLYLSEQGTIKITASSDTEVKGTFSGTVKNLQEASKVITEGKFEAKIVEAED